MFHFYHCGNCGTDWLANICV